MLTILCFSLCGCRQPKEHQDVKKFVVNTKTTKPIPIKPLPKFLSPPEIKNTNVKNPRLSKDITFHQYALSELTLIGCLTSPNKKDALIASPNDEIATIKTGDKLGKDSIRVTKIAPTYIQLIAPNDKSNKKTTLFLRTQSN